MKQINAIQKSIDSLEKEHRTGHFEPRKGKKEPRVTAPIEPITTGKINPDTGKIDYDKSMYKNEGDTAPATESTQDAAAKARRRNEAQQDRDIKNITAEPIIQRKPPYRTDVQQDVELDLKGAEIQPGEERRVEIPEEARKKINTSLGRSRDAFPVNDETTPRTPSPKKDERADDDIDDDPTRNIDYSLDKGAGEYRSARKATPEHIRNRDKSKAEIGRGDVKRQGPEGIRVPSRPVPEEENFDMMRKAVENSLLKLMQYGGV